MGYRFLFIGYWLLRVNGDDGLYSLYGYFYMQLSLRTAAMPFDDAVQADFQLEC